MHRVSAWADANRLVLGQEATEEKSNEITAIPKLLALLELHGCIVTIDAMGCQRAIAERIVEQGGDYVLGLKGNQGSLHEAVEEYFTTAQAADFKFISSIAADAKQFAHAVRGHWSVENRLHWRLDVVFREDESRIRKGNAPAIMTAIRHLCVNLFQKEPSKLSLKKKRQNIKISPLQA